METSTTPPLQTPSLRALAGVFFRTGSFTFGGGSATVVALEQDVVERRHWLEWSQFRLAYAIARITPGTSILATCTAVGWSLLGVRGALAALLAASVPCTVLVIFLTHLYEAWSANARFALGLKGAAAAAVGIVGASAWRLLSPYLRSKSWPRAVVLTGGSFALAQLGLAPLRVLLIAALVSLAWRDDRTA